MPCQLMLGFFAFAKTLDINVDKEELEGIYKLPTTLWTWSARVLLKSITFLICILVIVVVAQMLNGTVEKR